MARLQHLVLLEGGETLSSLIDAELGDELAKAVSERGIPIEAADRLQPWLISTMVSLPVCEFRRKKSGEKVLDQVIAEAAMKRGITVSGLETMEEQFTAISSLPNEYHLKALEETLTLGNTALDVIETMKNLYKRGETGNDFPDDESGFP